MNYTSIEQSKKLLSLGLKAESADMCYQRNCKELPIWRKRNDFEYPTQFVGVLITGGDTTTLPVLVANGYEIPIKDLLEKLPKEE